MGAPTAPNRAARRAAPAKKSTPANTRVVLDLDSLDKAEAFPNLDLPTELFAFILNGHQYELRDPRDSDWKKAWQLATNPFLLMRDALVGADDAVADPTAEELGAARERQQQERVAERAEAQEERAGDDHDEAASQDKAEQPEPPVVMLIDRFTAADLPGWKLNALFERWHAHYKIDLAAGGGILATLLGHKGE